MSQPYLITFLLFFILFNLNAQEEHFVNPVIREFGGIHALKHATVKPDPHQRYRIIVDLVSGQENPKELNRALNNVARMINLHAVGGVSPDSLDIVLATHGGATVALLNDDAYESRFACPNPNLPLIDALDAIGVIFTVCGQSLRHEEILPNQVYSKVGIATSMLTTVTMYQQKGYHLLRF